MLDLYCNENIVSCVIKKNDANEGNLNKCGDDDWVSMNDVINTMFSNLNAKRTKQQSLKIL